MPQDSSPARVTMTSSPVPRINEVAHNIGTFGRHGFDPSGTIMRPGPNNSFVYYANEDDMVGVEFQDAELAAALEEPEAPPDAEWTATPRELIRDGPLPIYTSTTPDVALTPRGSATPPIPYDTFARPMQPLSFPPSVRATGQDVMNFPSQQRLTFGAEQGVALGVASGTIMGPVETLQHSTTVRAEGEFVVRDQDAVWMNNRNNIGVADLTGSTVVNAPANENTAPPEAEAAEEEEGFFRGLWNDAKDLGSSAAEAIGEFDRNHGRVLTRGVGVIQAVGGAAEAVGGAVLATGGAVITPTGVGTAPGIGAMAGGAFLWVNGWDNAWTGMQTAWTGEFQQTMMSQAAGDVAGLMGASPETVQTVENATDLASGALSLGAGLSAGARTTAREVVEAGARQVDEVATEAAEQTARVTRPLTNRVRYLGYTPRKGSRVGQEVRERMRREGNLRYDPELGEDVFRADDGIWRPVDRPNVHMGHHPVDAVDYWNDTGRHLGPRHPTNDAWMRNSDNYRFEYGPENSARGGATPSRYLPPTTE